jgi:CPA1 family monovalent cation:H+ antiporter
VPLELFLVAAAVAVALLFGRLLAGRIGVPEAAAYVLIGVAGGLLPGLPPVRLSPDMVLYLFLPPLVYYAAFFSDPRETLDHLGAIVSQSVGLVLATAVAAAAAVVALFPDVGWAAALAFGAAVAPPDPVAATTVLQRLGVPDRLVTVLEGEGLVNDGVALTLFAVAVSSMGTTPSTQEVLGHVAVEILGGIGFGLLLGVVVAWMRERTRDPLSQAVWSLATPFLAFVPANLVGASGVLATVTAAVWLGTRGRGVVAPTSRLQTETFWRVLNLLLVGVLFVLLGFQVPHIMAGVAGYPVGTLVLISAGVVVLLAVVRLLWALLVPAPLGVPKRTSRGRPRLSRRERVALGWCGPRGAVSLAVALSLPLSTPRRDLLLFLTVVVVLATLVGQVLTLPALLRLLRLTPSERERTEGLRARWTMVEAALRDVEDVAAGQERDPDGLETVRQVLELRRDRLLRQLDEERGQGHDQGHEDGPATGRTGADTTRPDEQEMQRRVLEVERRTLRELGARGEVGRRTQVELSQELDLDDARLNRGR